MENNMNTTEQTTQAGNMGNETEVQGASGKEKLFTQEEVNSFVQSRIARLKSQAIKEAQTEYDQKLAELQAREMKLLVKEKLDERGMSRELADLLTCTDEADINKKLDTLQKIYGTHGTEVKKEEPKGFMRVGAESGGSSGIYAADPVRKAMGLE